MSIVVFWENMNWVLNAEEHVTDSYLTVLQRRRKNEEKTNILL